MEHKFGSQIAINTALAIPPVRDAYWRRQRNASGYGGDHNDPRRINAVFERHATEYASLLGPITGDVLEIGPGGSIGIALKFLHAGARSATCLDVVPLLSGTDDEYDALVPDAARLRERVSYRCPESVVTTTLPSASFDFVYSTACLEHVDDPAGAVRTIARVLKPGGATCHQIDLRDHTDFEAPLSFLKYSDRLWRLATSRRVYTNRWRMSDWIDALRMSASKSIRTAPPETSTPRRPSLTGTGCTRDFVSARSRTSEPSGSGSWHADPTKSSV